MEIYETARQLGKLILESEESAILRQVQEELNAQTDATKMLDDYNAYRSHVQQKMQAGDMTKEDFNEASETLSQKAKEVKQDPFISRMLLAESEFNNLVNRVLAIIRMTITKEDEDENAGCSGCSGGSGGCSGCH